MKPSLLRPAIIPSLLILVALGQTACSRNPTLEISGAFFPAWMVSILIGIVVTLAIRQAFISFGIDPYLKPHLLIYSAMSLGFTLLAWLLLYW